MTEETKRFNPNEHLVQLKSKQGSQDYLPVQWRLVWFRSECPHGTIDTEEKEVDLDRVVEVEAFVWNAEKRRSEKVIKKAKGYARFRAVATNGKGGRGTGTKAENAASFPDFIEKSETGAIGRALATLGYGTQFTDQEFAEGERLADAPVNQRNNNQEPAGNNSRSSTPGPDSPATEQQLDAIRKLSDLLEKPYEEAPATFLEAKQTIKKLQSSQKERNR